jgi:hypothetical protein
MQMRRLSRIQGITVAKSMQQFFDSNAALFEAAISFFIS